MKRKGKKREKAGKKSLPDGQERPDLFRYFSSHSSDGIILADERGTIIEYNRALEQLTGWRKEDVVGTAIWDFQSRVSLFGLEKPGHREQVKAAFQEFLRTGQAPWIHGPDERELVHRDGTRRVVQSVIFPIRAPGTFMVGSILHDITSQKQVREKAELLHGLLRHDLKNKNLVALGYLQLLEKSSLPEEAQKLVARLLATIEGSQELIAKISLLHAISRDQEVTKVNLDWFIHAAIEKNLEEASKRGIVIQRDRISFDVLGGSLLEELFHNLIENAVKHANCRVIKISCHDEGRTAVITVEDDGQGIPGTIKANLFTRGIKGEDSTGHGLGLYLINQIALHYGGTVTVNGPETGGTRFLVTLQKA
ncbi:MAG: ATP-binding protein [Candidatus Odinarchaeota archaeon]